MIDILQSKSGITKFQILTEVAAHQPNVRQKEIAEKIGVTPQAVSEYIKELTAEGFIFSDGRVRYRITKKGVEWVLEGAADMKRYANFVMSDIISHVSTWTAIADEDLEKGDDVYLQMRKGLLYVSKTNITSATGITISSVEKGDDVGVTNLLGMIELETASITVCKIPRSERGGSRNVDLERLEKLASSKSFIAVIGVESLVALKKINKEPDVMYGAKESIVEAAFHGLSSLVLAIDEEVPQIMSRLETENLEYELVDLNVQ
ncbi:winged helix-turn-helix transcriptional regulator [Methanococcoides burtonii]|uniref:HTH DNA-binding domain protein n=1 Tax=Methanococcoides burtonii (strain DSM 6242 / NBRC 107633 / OCM 468 / ACE-M) TaxID=259564 RepID=Q12W99_METBU|nr:winged helix-turn-helix transcriptional regulator [Methanococcoides burtonii]ABE52277.1 HTH DNA-binding domain protein [Methanococcoides burtonii DSM 6242]